MSKEITLEKLASIPQVRLLKTNESKDTLGFYWDKSGRNEFYTLNPATKEHKKITDGELPRTIRAGYEWLKDSQQIIFAKDKQGNEQHNLHLFNLKAREETQLTETPDANEIPFDVSPNGKYLCFGSTREGQMNLFKINVRTKEVAQLTDHEAPTWSGAVWAENGWIYYACNETKNLRNRDIWTVKEDGSKKKLVLQVTDDSQEDVADSTQGGTS